MNLFSRKVLYFISICVLIISCQSKPTKDELAVKQFFRAYKTKSAINLKALTSDKLTIGIYDKTNFELITSGIFHLPTFQLDSGYVVSVEKPDSNYLRKVNVMYLFKDQSPIESSITLDSSHLITNIALWDQFYSLNREAKSELIDSIPIGFNEHSISMPMRINQSEERLNMLFDTGSDGIGITLASSERIGMSANKIYKTKLIGSDIDVRFSQNNTLNIGSQTITNKRVGIFKEMREHLDGVIGGIITNRYKTKIDFDKKMMYFYSFGKYEKKQFEIPFVLNENRVPMVKLTITLDDGRQLTGNYIFDTGADFNLVVFSNYVNKENLLDGLSEKQASNIKTMGRKSMAFMGLIKQVSLGDFNFGPLEAGFEDPKAMGNILERSCGSIGMKLISHFNFTIDYANRVIVLEPRAEK